MFCISQCFGSTYIEDTSKKDSELRSIDFGIAGEHFALSFPEITDDFHVRLMDAEANCVLALF
ncbi:MAG: hypothetical protein ABJN14_23290 [Paracoccaceae bacterium]